MDTKGPEVRSGDVAEPLQLAPGDAVVFTIQEGADGKDNRISGGERLGQLAPPCCSVGGCTWGSLQPSATEQHPGFPAPCSGRSSQLWTCCSWPPALLAPPAAGQLELVHGNS